MTPPPSTATAATTTATTRLGPADLAGLAARMRGAVIGPGDAGYDGARRVWNGMIDRRPAVIARCAGVADVVAAVGFAREHGLRIAVRGGGHNVAGTAVCDGGIVIDLSPMRGVRVDPGRRTVWAQGGCTWADLDGETQPFGLAVPGGVVSETGIAGLTLSGGLSAQRRAHGMTIDNLIAAEVVTADGRYLRASAEEHPDLLWALKGGGGNFGVVTAFEYRAHPHGPQVYEVKAFHPLEEAAEVLRAWREAIAGAPEAVTSEAAFWAFPPAPELPGDLHGVPFLLIAGHYAGPVDEAEEALRPLRELGTPMVDASGVAWYLEEQRALDPMVPAGNRYYWTGRYLDGLGDAAIDLIVDHAVTTPSLLGPVVIRQLGGAIGRVPAEATAFGDRSAPFHLSIDASWTDPADDARCIGWARAFHDAARPFGSGKVYLNFAGMLEEGEEAVRATFGRNLDRLRAVKTAYDPENLFRLNANIAPR